MAKKRKPKKKETEMQRARRLYGNGTTYKDGQGRTRKRIAKPGTARGRAYCARTVGQKRTAKVRVRRQAWGCSGKNSRKK